MLPTIFLLVIQSGKKFTKFCTDLETFLETRRKRLIVLTNVSIDPCFRTALELEKFDLSGSDPKVIVNLF